MSKRHARKQSFTLAVLTCIAAACPAFQAYADDDVWNVLSGNFNNAANWTPALPGAADRALFSFNTTYSVTFNTSPTNADFVVSSGVGTWLTDGTARTYTTSGDAAITGGALTLGSSSAALTVYVGGNLGIKGAVGYLNVAGNNTLTCGNGLSLGFDGLAGHVNTVADSSNITLTGASALSIGAASGSTGTLSLTAGAFTSGTGLTTLNPTGVINISGGTFTENGDLSITGGNLTQTAGAFSWAASHNMTIQSAGTVNLTGLYATPASANITVTGAGSQLNDNTTSADLTINNGAQLTVTNGASVSSAGEFDVGRTGNGTAIFDGANTSLSAPSPSDFIGRAGSGSLTIRNNAVASLGGLIIGVVNGSNSSLNIQAGATVSLGTTQIASSLTSATGSINISGGTLTQPGVSGFSIGTSSTSNGSINVSGGSFSTGTDVTSVYATGSINLSGGSFTANGDLAFIGGTLTQTTGAFSWAPSHNMTIQSGGKVNLGTFTTPASANITISGSGSQLNANGANFVVTSGAQVNIAAGGTLTGPGSITVNATGSIDISGGSFAPNGDLSISGGDLTQTTGAFSLAPSHNLTIQSGGTVSLNGPYTTPTNANITLTGPGSQLADTNSADLAIDNGTQLAVSSGASVSSSGAFEIGATLTGTATFDGPNTSLSVTGATYIGRAGTGALTFSNNTGASLGQIYLGYNPASNGSLNIQSGANITLANATIGQSGGSGSINITGGTLSVGNVSIAPVQGAGNLSISGGNLSLSGNLTVGQNSTVSFSGGNPSVYDLYMSGGTVNQSANITITALSMASGVYNLTGSATLSPSIETIGAGEDLASYTVGNSTFNQTGGTNNTSYLYMAQESPGTYNLSGNATLITGGEWIGQAAAGVFSQTGGTHTSNGDILLSGPRGTYTLSGGSLAVNGSMIVGGYDSNPIYSGTLNIQSGTAVITHALAMYYATDTVNFSGGNLSVGSFDFSGNPAPHFNWTAGNLTMGGDLFIEVGGLLGANLSLDPSRSLTLTGNTTINPQCRLVLVGGSLSTAAIANFGSFSFSNGSLTITGPSGFTNAAGAASFSSNLKLDALTITGGTVDLTSSKLIIETSNATAKSSTLAALQSNIATGALIASTMPANFGVALLDNAVTQFKTFGGLPADASSLLLSPELLGDANADGIVNLTDLNTVLTHLGSTTPAWTSGNFDGSTTIDLTDLNTVLNNLGLTYANSSAITSPIVPTPEPASLSLLAGATCALFAKQRTRRC
jgi:T5SS/PEP-CTERM-associated repeat protein